MHIYAFGSICRGELTPGSDIDLLAIVDAPDRRFDPATYSIYSSFRLRQLWGQGNPFAWHLFRESRLIFSDDGRDFLRDLKEPQPYRTRASDCQEFRRIFVEAAARLRNGTKAEVFELAVMFLAVRNIATCFSLNAGGEGTFSRDAARQLGDRSLTIDAAAYYTLETARTLSTRGYGGRPTAGDVARVKESLGEIEAWMDKLVAEAE